MVIAAALTGGFAAIGVWRTLVVGGRVARRLIAGLGRRLATLDGGSWDATIVDAPRRGRR